MSVITSKINKIDDKMKKFILSACAVFAMALTFTSCDKKAKAVADQAEMTVLMDSIKNEAISIFEDIEIQRVHLMQEVIVTPKEVIVLDPKFFLDLDMAAKAEDMNTKASLMGMYGADQAINEQCYGAEIKTAERAAVIRGLATDLNLALPTDAELDSIAKINKLQAQQAASGITADNFRRALESNSADIVVRALVHFISEITLDNCEVYNQLNGFVDEVDMAKQVQPATPIMTNCVKLINLLSPCYPSLAELGTLTEKVNAILEVEEDSDEYYAAIIEYFNYIKTLRAEIAPVEARD